MEARQTWHDATDAQISLHRYYHSDAGMKTLQAKFSTEVDGFATFIAPRTQRWKNVVEMTDSLYQGERNRLMQATPFFISREMCELVMHASKEFQPEPIFPTDFLELCGFMYFERPFDVTDRYQRPLYIAACSWQPILVDNGAHDEARFKTDGELREWLEERHRSGIVDGLALTIYERNDTGIPNTPPIFPVHLTPWYWGMEFEGNEIDLAGKPTGAGWWWRIIQTTLRLMQQRITVRHNSRGPRAQRRAAKRYGIPEQDTVVVRLRREGQTRPSENGGDANYSHRFIVGHHWRNQWYPSQKVHRQIWIDDYVKGPEDKPLVIKPRAYNWSR